MYDVVVVDDDFIVAEAHQRGVELVPGFSVSGVAYTGTTALELIGGLRPKLVLLDLHLPDMSGLDVMRRAREAGYDVDFLVVSSAREAELVAAALHGGIVDYLMKPFKRNELQVRLARYAERRRVLDCPGLLTQRDLDEALGSVSGTRNLPKGLSEETAALVEGLLRRCAHDVAASECSDDLGLSRVVARKYLEHFERTGQATVALRYGRTGRPQRRFSWTGASPESVAGVRPTA
jgi:response regulator of citrate/malate metabolism